MVGPVHPAMVGPVHPAMVGIGLPAMVGIGLPAMVGYSRLREVYPVSGRFNGIYRGFTGGFREV